MGQVAARSARRLPDRQGFGRAADAGRRGAEDVAPDLPRPRGFLRRTFAHRADARRARGFAVPDRDLLALAASGSAAYAWQQLRTNEAFLNATLKRATEIIDEAVAQAEKYNVPRTATLRLLVKAEGLFDDMAKYGRPTPELRYRKAWMLIQFARNYEILGDTGKQFAHANEAQRLLAGLAAEKPDDFSY